ncbi:hypothetical protein C8J57DRAFT_1728223 [Mycena rebaudengoi]|nr:hypothetical protein C8J57DRAFT_1732759 [Mycena rebaudengoi]KAJ7236492.1 hypothetical protein C8J57DRAFT_1728223 [Mycena rebaudengoi]
MAAVPLDDATIAYTQSIDRYFYLTGIVLLSYDHLLTFESEVRYIWMPVQRKASAWYLIVRYFALCANVVMFALAFSNIPTNDMPALDLLFVLQELLIEMTLFRRVLAMYSFHRRVRFILAIAALIAISLIIVRA